MEVVHRAGPAAAGGPTTMPEEEVAVQLWTQLLLNTLKMQPHHVNKKLISPLLFVLQEYFVATPSMHGIAAITGNITCILERITSI